MQTREQRGIQTVESRFALEPDLQAAALEAVGEREAAVPILTEERVTEDHVRPRIAGRECLDLVEDPNDGSRAVPRQNPVRAVGAELRTAAAGQQRESTTCRPARIGNVETPAGLRNQIPSREGQAVEVVDLRAVDDTVEDLPGEQAHERRFGLARENEVGVIPEELGHLGSGQADEADAHAARSHRVGKR